MKAAQLRAVTNLSDGARGLFSIDGLTSLKIDDLLIPRVRSCKLNVHLQFLLCMREADIFMCINLKVYSIFQNAETISSCVKAASASLSSLPAMASMSAGTAVMN